MRKPVMLLVPCLLVTAVTQGIADEGIITTNAHVGHVSLDIKTLDPEEFRPPLHTNAHQNPRPRPKTTTGSPDLETSTQSVNSDGIKPLNSEQKRDNVQQMNSTLKTLSQKLSTPVSSPSSVERKIRGFWIPLIKRSLGDHSLPDDFSTFVDQGLSSRAHNRVVRSTPDQEPLLEVQFPVNDFRIVIKRSPDGPAQISENRSEHQNKTNHRAPHHHHKRKSSQHKHHEDEHLPKENNEEKPSRRRRHHHHLHKGSHRFHVVPNHHNAHDGGHHVVPEHHEQPQHVVHLVAPPHQKPHVNNPHHSQQQVHGQHHHRPGHR